MTIVAVPRRLLRWWEKAACIETPHLHTADIPHGVIGSDGPQAWAVHICRVHCPVIDDCRDDIADRTPRGVVQAGIVWPDHGPIGRTARRQPTDPGCGSWCAHLTEVGR